MLRRSTQPRRFVLTCAAGIVAALAAALCWPACGRTQDAAAELEFFERHIRPLLSVHCYECHGADGEPEAGLRLDSSAGWLHGGDSGPAIVPGEPDRSLLLRALRYEPDAPAMPPTGKLPDEALAAFERWIARGAAAPTDEQAAPAPEAAIDLEAGRRHWAYQPLAEGQPPPAADGTAADAERPAIDRFLDAELQAAGLAPAPRAERPVLIRRLYFDLWGLPPSPEEIAAFVQDESPAAYAALVDRLLAGPQFGERWARHWLDLARYAESLTLRGFILPQAWRYRDYVIQAFDRDLSYDRFLREQIAGDLLDYADLADRQQAWIATGFLALGNTNLEEQDKQQLDLDVVDEQLDVLGKALLAQTVSCARCHDHKFDPIPTRDYYALAGILYNARPLEHANVSQWTELPLPLAPDEATAYDRREAALAALAEQITAQEQRVAQLAAAGVVAAGDLPGVVIDDAAARIQGAWKASRVVPLYVGDGYIHDEDQGKGEKTITFVPELPADGRYEVRLAYAPGTNRAPRVPVTVFSADGERTVDVNMQQAPPVEGRWVVLGEFQCERAGQNFVLISTGGTQGHVIADAVQYLSVAERDARAAEPEQIAAAGAELAAAKQELAALQAQRAELQGALPPRPLVLTVRERADVRDLAIHHRGSVHTLGDVVPRGFLQVVPPLEYGPLPPDASGRRELAAWLTSPENPLPARVWVNRVWHWLFGQGLVRTVDNFGTTGEAPSHPELLDYLAREFIAGGWSTKRLIRQIVLTEAYRRTSFCDALAHERDPENRWLARMSRQRLEAECLRDALLVVSGQLDATRGGPTLREGLTADYDYEDASLRRSIYLPVLRNALPTVCEAFDFPDPSLVVGQRNASTSPQQALWLLNDPFVREQAAAAAARLLAEELPDLPAQIDRAFWRTLGRAPSPEERAVALGLVQPAAAESPADADQEHARWTDLFHLLFCSLDFRYRD